MDSRTLNLYVSAFYKVVFCLLGCIGNLLFIHLIYKRRQLQSRTSILQCIQCVFHIFCSIGTVQNGVLDVGASHTRSECFNEIAYYIFFQAAQGLIMLVIVVDILVFVRFPVLYRTISKTTYILTTSIPILAFSLFTTFYGYMTTNDDVVFSCSPPFAFGPEASVIYKYLFIVLALIIMVLYCLLILIFRARSRGQSCAIGSRKTIKRLKLTVVIFFLSWFVGQVLGLVILQISNYPKWVGMLLVHNVFFVCLSYSNTFYVTILRSTEYRNQFYILWCPGRLQTSGIAFVNASSHSQKLRDSDLMFQKRTNTV